MSTLKEILTAPGVRGKVIEDCDRVVEEEVASKSGLSGLAIKGGFAVVKAMKPGMVKELMGHLLEDFSDRLDPIYQAAKSKNEPVAAYFNARPGEVADALLGITDDRAKRAKNQGLKSLYEKLRPQGKKQVEMAVPRIGRVIAKHTAAAAAPAPTP